MKDKSPSVFAYGDPRDFVREYDLWAKRHLKNYSRRAFARWAGISSSNFLTLVVSGKKPMHLGWIDGFSKAAKLSGLEKRYFKLLVEMSLSKEAARTRSLYQKLKMLAFSSKVFALCPSEMFLLSSLEVWDLFHLLGAKGHANDFKLFKKKLNGRISVKKISETIRAFEQMKILGRRSSGEFFPLKDSIKSEDQIAKQENYFFHKMLLKESERVLEEHDPKQRAFGSLTILTNRHNLNEMKKDIEEFGMSLFSKYGHEDPNAQDLVRVNIQLYPVTDGDIENV